MTRKPLTKAELSAIASRATVPVTRIPEGERATSERELFLAARGEQSRIEERRVVIDHCGRERVRNGLGEWIA